MARPTVLIIEDELAIRQFIHLFLESKNYRVILAENGTEGIELAKNKQPQLVLLDIEMPGMDGFDVCKSIRKILHIPIIFVSNRRGVEDKIKCFELGGDDYVTKPFDFDELEARIKANIRRYNEIRNGNEHLPEILTYGSMQIQLNSYKCYINGTPITLSKKEMQLLILLAKRPNQVFSAEQIYDQIWGIDSYGDIQTVKVHIRKLRSKIEEDPSDPKYIITVRGFGYRFVG